MKPRLESDAATPRPIDDEEKPPVKERPDDKRSFDEGLQPKESLYGPRT